MRELGDVDWDLIEAAFDATKRREACETLKEPSPSRRTRSRATRSGSAASARTWVRQLEYRDDSRKHLKERAERAEADAARLGRRCVGFDPLARGAGVRPCE